MILTNTSDFLMKKWIFWRGILLLDCMSIHTCKSNMPLQNFCTVQSRDICQTLAQPSVVVNTGFKMDMMMMICVICFFVAFEP